MMIIMAHTMLEVFWTLDNAEWERAKKRRAENPPHSNYHARRLALYYLLNGNFDLRVNSAYLYKNEGGPLNISLLDFATFAASVLVGGFTNTFVEYDQLDETVRSGSILPHPPCKFLPVTARPRFGFLGRSCWRGSRIS